MIQTGPGWLYCAPTYYSQEMYQRAAGSRPLCVSLPSKDCQLDVSAALNESRETLFVFVVNVRPEPIATTVQLSGFAGCAAKCTETILKDRDDALCAEIMNTRDDPVRVTPLSRDIDLSGGTCAAVLDPLSLTLIEMALAKN